MMSHKKSIPFLFVILLILVACGSAASEPYALSDGAGAAMEEAAAEPMSVEMEERSFDGNDMAFAADIGESVDMSTTVNQSAPVQQERLIIRTANLSLIVSDTEETLADISQMADQNGGWVVSSNVYQYNDNAKSGDITMRVPSSGFNNALDALKEMAVEVESENISGQDVTEEYVDLNSRLGNLEATADRVRAFMDEAKNVEEALAVNQELSRLEGEIEVIKGRMQYLSQSASFSTITVFLTPDIVTLPVQVGGWRPQGVAKDALETLLETLQGLASFAIWVIIYIVPILLLIGVPLWLVIRFVWRRWRRRKGPEDTAVTPIE
ncbi:MAG: DUF4349 domain-containing protein [Chloroflexi bacterium]|nr:DUF4349 domain-containing protein [Chloroflexota bacterium]